MNEIETNKNKDRIDLDISTPDEKIKPPTISESVTIGGAAADPKGEIFGPNYRKN